MADPEREAVRIDIRSIYGVRTRQGIVEVEIGEHSWQISAEEARRVARMLVECAEAADTDELVVALLTAKIGLPVEQAALVLVDLRALRAAKYGEEVPGGG